MPWTDTNLPMTRDGMESHPLMVIFGGSGMVYCWVYDTIGSWNRGPALPWITKHITSSIPSIPVQHLLQACSPCKCLSTILQVKKYCLTGPCGTGFPLMSCMMTYARTYRFRKHTRTQKRKNIQQHRAIKPCTCTPTEFTCAIFGPRS